MKYLILISILLTGCAGVYQPYQSGYVEYYPYRPIFTPYNPYQGYYGPNYGVIQPYRSYPRFHQMH